MGLFDDVKNWFSGNTPVQPLNTVAPEITTTEGATKTFGTAPEPNGYNVSGGRRHRTRRHKKSKKTSKRKH